MNPVLYKQHFNPDTSVKETFDYEGWPVFAEDYSPRDPYLASYVEDKDEFADIISYIDELMDRLREQYEFRDSAAIETYIEQNPSLFNLLMNARDKIREHFGSDAHVVLEAVKGLEADNDKRLFVFVQTESSSDEALDRLDELYEKWWIDALSTARPKLSIDVEYI